MLSATLIRDQVESSRHRGIPPKGVDTTDKLGESLSCAAGGPDVVLKNIAERAYQRDVLVMSVHDFPELLETNTPAPFLIAAM